MPLDRTIGRSGGRSALALAVIVALCAWGVFEWKRYATAKRFPPTVGVTTTRDATGYMAHVNVFNPSAETIKNLWIRRAIISATMPDGAALPISLGDLGPMRQVRIELHFTKPALGRPGSNDLFVSCSADSGHGRVRADVVYAVRAP